MSHTVKIPVTFKAAEQTQLERAFRALEWEVATQVPMRTYNQANPVMPLVAVNPGKDRNSYDIEIRREGPELTLHTDLWGGSVEASLGQGLGRLKQRYAAEVVASEYPTGVIQEETDEEGNLYLNVQLY
jgi:hypothetical protein